jgi:AraC-like DNA-binding protein
LTGCANVPAAPSTIAITSTRAMVCTAEGRGFRTADLLERVALSRETLEDPDARIAGRTALELWNALIERTEDPALQLAAPTQIPFGAYRVIDYLVGASATVGEGIERFARFFRLIADAVVLRIERAGDCHDLCFEMADGGAPPAVYVDYVFAALVGRIRMRIRPELDVHRVDLRRPRPADPRPYEDRFRAPLRFGADRDRLRFSAVEWESPIAGADAALARVLEEHARVLAARLPSAPTDFVASVQSSIVAALPESAEEESVARALHMSRRTLQRKLAHEGTSFREVLDGVRRGLAESYLTDRAVSIPEVAFLLGFSEQSSFHRAFQRWTGSAPGRWRREHRPLTPAGT